MLQWMRAICTGTMFRRNRVSMAPVGHMALVTAIAATAICGSFGSTAVVVAQPVPIKRDAPTTVATPKPALPLAASESEPVPAKSDALTTGAAAAAPSERNAPVSTFDIMLKFGNRLPVEEWPTH